jgi:hypothetical protein
VIPLIVIGAAKTRLALPNPANPNTAANMLPATRISSPYLYRCHPRWVPSRQAFVIFLSHIADPAKKQFKSRYGACSCAPRPILSPPRKPDRTKRSGGKWF